VLIQGASGGIGTFAVQIAKSFGAQVTGVCCTLPVLDYYRALSPAGVYVMAGGSIGRFIPTAFQRSQLFSSGSKRMKRFTYSPTMEDLMHMKELIEAGSLRPIIDKVYPLSKSGEALRYLGNGQAKGRVVIRIE